MNRPKFKHPNKRLSHNLSDVHLILTKEQIIFNQPQKRPLGAWLSGFQAGFFDWPPIFEP